MPSLLKFDPDILGIISVPRLTSFCTKIVIIKFYKDKCVVKIFLCNCLIYIFSEDFRLWWRGLEAVQV